MFFTFTENCSPKQWVAQYFFAKARESGPPFHPRCSFFRGISRHVIDLRAARSETFDMNLSNTINRVPIPFDGQKGQDVAALLPEFGPELRALIAGAAGSSPYLAGLIEKEQEWLRSAVEDVDRAVSDEIASTALHAPDTLANGLRRAKRRVAMAAALADLGGGMAARPGDGRVD